VHNSFADHAARLAGFLDRAPQIVQDIEARLLNVQGKELAHGADPRRLEETLNSCFGPSRPLDHLAIAHAERGLAAVPFQDRSHQLDPVALIARAHE
jgi:hypothetical protein